MDFPLWRYLRQPLWDASHPAILNPFRYWEHHKVRHLGDCLNHNFLEECWKVDYQDFVTYHQHLCNRTPLEEDAVWLLERCWRLRRRGRSPFPPENMSHREKSS